MKPTYEELEQRVKKLEQEAVMRKQVEKTLRESEHKLHTHLQNTPIGAITWDLNFRVIEWNPAAKVIFGYSKKEALGKHPTELILPEKIKEEINGVFKDLISENRGARSINNNLTKNGRRIICDWYNTTLRNTDGNVIGAASLVDDITDRKQAEEELKQSEKNLSRMFQFADYMVCIADLEKGYFTKISPAFTRCLGWSEKELLSKPILDFIYPGDVEKTTDAFKQQLETGNDVIQFENRYFTKKGDIRYLVWSTKPVSEEGITYAAAYDITDRKKAEEALKNSKKNLHTLIQNIQAGVVVHGSDTKIKDCNKVSQELLGLTEDQMFGKAAIDPSWKFYEEDGSDMSLERYPVNQVITSKNELKNMIVGIHRPDRENINVLVNAIPEFDSDGNIFEIIVTFVDITERIQAEEARENILKSLRKALDEVKTLSGLVPICSKCKKIRDDRGYWRQIEAHIQKHTHAKFSHGICPECSDDLYGNEDWYIKMKKEKE